MIIHYEDGVETHTSHEGRVVDLETVHYHVSSDNAMLDSGERNIARVWVNGRVEVVGLTSGRGGNTWAVGMVDPDEPTRRKAEEYNVLITWIKSLRSVQYQHSVSVRDSHKVKEGCEVEVIAGRKVKRGTTWKVTQAGVGGYGPYVHLDNGRERVKFVSPDNLKVINQEEPELVYADCPFGPVNADIIGVALNLLEYIDNYCYEWAADELKSRWNILHDAWQDSGFPVPDAVRRATFCTDD